MKSGKALLPLLFNFALEYSIKRVQANQEGLKLNGTEQILVYVDNVNILSANMHTIRKNTASSLITNKQLALEVNAEKTKYMVVSRSECRTEY